MASATTSEAAGAPIAVVRGGASAAIQALMRDFAGRCGAHVRVVGLVEDAGPDGAALVSLTDARRYPLFQPLGAGSGACALDPEAVIAAGEALRGEIAAGCDLVVLSKFGKLEAENRSGLIAAFAAALEAGVPVLTAVSPRHDDAWAAFAAPLYTVLAAELAALEAWWRGLRPAP